MTEKSESAYIGIARKIYVFVYMFLTYTKINFNQFFSSKRLKINTPPALTATPAQQKCKMWDPVQIKVILLKHSSHITLLSSLHQRFLSLYSILINFGVFLLLLNILQWEKQAHNTY